MKTLTVITATYNRAYCLHQLYASLLRQDCDDFLWLVIDDGSSDGTKELIDGWIFEGRVDIRYHYKPNGGMHTARNMAYMLADTELNVIIDSDDWMTDGAVGLIVRFWQSNKRDDVAGIISLNADPSGMVIGSPIIDNLREATTEDFFGKYGMRGDKKLIYRSDLTKLYPYPEFSGEKYYPASYKFRLLDQSYTMLVLDAVTCVVDYSTASQSRGRKIQYETCAKGFVHYRNTIMRISHTPKEIFRSAVHYVAESLFAKEKKMLCNAARKDYVLFALLPGALLHIFLVVVNRRRKRNPA